MTECKKQGGPKAPPGKVLKMLDHALESCDSSPFITKVIEQLAAGSLASMSTVVFIYGMVYIVPEIMKPFSIPWKILVYGISVWIFFCVLTNMYLIHKRIRPIGYYSLPQPPRVLRLLIAPKNKVGSSMVTETGEDEETTKIRKEYSKAEPFGDESNWHYCAKCDVFIPPRAWHCDKCQTCILRRDHHCWFVGKCIGEENFCNFIGMLFYFSVGTTLASNICIVYALCIEKMNFYWYLFRMTFFLFFIYFDFDLRYLLAYCCTFGQIPAWGFFFFLIYLSLKGQTMADHYRKISRSSKVFGGEEEISYENMCKFLGPKPIRRIIWPFHRPIRKDYGAPVIHFE